jgi:hypothetical protein
LSDSKIAPNPSSQQDTSVTFAHKNDATGVSQAPYPSTFIYDLSDPLRRDFLAECCDHVARVASNAAFGISQGNDRLFEAQVELMRITMSEAMRTYEEMTGKKFQPLKGQRK